MRDVKFPVSYSLHSVDLIETDENPGLTSLTFRLPGEIRVVHGNEDVYAAIKSGVDVVKCGIVAPEKKEGEEKKDEEKKTGEEKEEEKEEKMNEKFDKLGVKIFPLKSEVLQGRDGILVSIQLQICGPYKFLKLYLNI